MKINEVLKSMTNVTPDSSQIERIERLRNVFKNLAIFANEITPNNKYQEIAFDKLENSLMYFVKSIVLEENKKNKMVELWCGINNNWCDDIENCDVHPGTFKNDECEICPCHDERDRFV